MNPKCIEAELHRATWIFGEEFSEMLALDRLIVLLEGLPGRKLGRLLVRLHDELELRGSSLVRVTVLLPMSVPRSQLKITL